MKYLLYDLGQAEEGHLVEITLGYAVNVRIMNEENYNSFSGNKSHKFMGGYVERSPYRVMLPFDDHWFAVIEAGSFFSKIKSLVKIKTNPMEDVGTIVVKPTVCELFPRKSLAKVTSFSDAIVKKNIKAFVLHYFKDSNSLAAPLAQAFAERGLPVNYTDYVLEPGHDVEKVIKNGLAKHRFGIIVISRSMIKAGWKQSEIDYIKDLITKDRLLIPVWHNVSKQQMSDSLPDYEDLILVREPEIKEVSLIVDEIIDILMKN